MNVLIIDDSNAVRDRLVERLRETNPAANLLQADSFDSAATAMQNNEIHAICTEIRANDVSCIPFLQGIGELNTRPGLIILTDNALPEYEYVCKKLGADFFFDKFNQFDEAVAAVNFSLHRNSRTASGHNPVDAGSAAS